MFSWIHSDRTGGEPDIAAGAGDATAHCPSPPDAVHARGSQGDRGSTEDVGTLNCPVEEGAVVVVVGGVVVVVLEPAARVVVVVAGVAGGFNE